MFTEGCSGFFLSGLELGLFAKIKKDLVSTPLQKPVLSITQGLNKIKRSRTRAKIQYKILNSMVVGACQSFQFVR